MSSFSERFGLVPPKVQLALDEMPDSMRNGLWDSVRATFFRDIGSEGDVYRPPNCSDAFELLTTQLQFRFLRRSLDELEPSPGHRLGRIKADFYKFGFARVYEFIEFILALADDSVNEIDYESFRILCNSVLERELAAVRIVGKQFVAITSENDLEAIGEAIGNSSSNSVSTHISAAASLYSQNPNPDYRNSIKESVSAVEAAVRFVTGKKTMGVAKPLKLIESEFEIHGALRDGFEKIFAFSSDADGVRHALMEKSNISQADARFMLVACSAFSNYLLSLKATQG